MQSNFFEASKNIFIPNSNKDSQSLSIINQISDQIFQCNSTENQVINELSKQKNIPLSKISKKTNEKFEHFMKADRVLEDNDEMPMTYSFKINDSKISGKQKEPNEKLSKIYWNSTSHKNIIFNPKATSEIFLRHLLHIQEGLTYVKQNLKEPNLKSILMRQVNLPEFRNFFFLNKLLN